jgi:hypothetical protein
MLNIILMYLTTTLYKEEQMKHVIEAVARGEKKAIPICLTRKQIVRLYRKQPVLFRRHGDRFLLSHKEDKRVSRIEAKIARYEARLAELKKVA